jgi:hypothetical protein
MKKVFLGIVVGLVAGGAGVWVFLHHDEAGESDAKKEEHNPESRVQHGTNGEVFLQLDKAAQERAGLKTAILEAAQLQPELKAFGRVLDPASLAAGMTDGATARAQLNGSSKELERLKILHGQNQNISTRALEAAEAIVKRDQIAVEAVQIRLVSTWGSALAKRADLDALVRSLVTQESALVRIDVPASEKLGGAPTGARVSLLSAPEAPLPADFLGPAVSADAQTLGRGFLFLVKGNSLAANAPLLAWLSLPGEMANGVIVPRDAIVRHDGEAFIYVQTGADAFARSKIQLEHPLDKGWFTDELKRGMKVVVSGAQQLLSEELKSQGGAE